MSTATPRAPQIVYLNNCGETHEEPDLQCMAKRFDPLDANVTYFSDMPDCQVIKRGAK